MKVVRASAIALLGFTAIAVQSCRAPTNVIVTVTTDMNCGDFKGATVAVGELATLESVPESTESTTCDGSKRIGSVVLEPSDSEDGAIAFRVVGGLGVAVESCNPPNYGPGCVVSRRALKYFPHDSLRVNVRLESSCAGIPCDTTETCVGGACYPATINDPSQCEGNGCDDSVITNGNKNANPNLTVIGNDPVWRFAHDTDYFYWGNRTTGELKRQLISLAQPAEVLNAPAGQGGAAPNGIFLLNGEVWWGSNDGGVYHCPVTGCGGNPTQVAQLDGHIADSVIVSGSTVYFTTVEQGTNPPLGAAGGDLYWCPTTGCQPLSQPNELVPTPGDPYRLTLDANNLYWTWATYIQGDPTNGRVRYAKLGDTSGAFTELADGQNDPWGIFVDATTVYWTNWNAGEIRSCPIAGCNNQPKLLASNQGTPVSIIEDGTTLYWSNDTATTGFVAKCDVNNCDATTTIVADNQDSPWDMFVDQTYIYWGSNGVAQPGIFRIPK